MKILKRIFIFIFAIFLCGFGIAISTQANLGTTPISSLPYVLTFVSPLSFGMTTIIINIFFLLIQIILLKNEFKKRDFLQIFVIFLFGAFIDLGMSFAHHFKSDIYFNQLIMLVLGSMILGLGVFFEVVANLLYIPGEGAVKAIAYKSGRDFGKMKILFDFSLCIIAIIVSLIFSGKVQGLREGTIFSAFLVGGFVCLYNKIALFIKNKRHL